MFRTTTRRPRLDELDGDRRLAALELRRQRGHTQTAQDAARYTHHLRRTLDLH